jgi:nucleoside-diphosphate-sugar epimerase
MQRGEYPWLEQVGAEVVRGDLADTDAVTRACQGCEVVFHVAGKTGVWGKFEDYFHTNVLGTESVITACLENDIPSLVYTSSPSVVFDGRDEEGIDESTPYPDKFFNHYQYTKGIAERKIMAVNSHVLATVSLRPHLIWGPEDPHLVGRIIARAEAGTLRLVNRNNKIDTTYIDNAVSAHLFAADTLRRHQSRCAGRAYFISNGEPIVMSDMVNKILTALGRPEESRKVSPWLAYLIGSLSEAYYHLKKIEHEPAMTRFIAKQLSCSHWYDISAAKADLGYNPKVSLEEGLKKLSNY